MLGVTEQPAMKVCFLDVEVDLLNKYLVGCLLVSILMSEHFLATYSLFYIVLVQNVKQKCRLRNVSLRSNH